METLLSLFQFFTRFYWIKRKLINHSKKYIFKYCIQPIIEEIKNEKLCKEEHLNISLAIHSPPFKGIIEYYLRPNEYNLTSKDIAAALSMGLYSYSNKTFDHPQLINISIYITKKIRERIAYDKNFKFILSELGKDITSIQTSERKEIENIFSTSKHLFEAYFNIYSTESYSDKITIYHPAENKTYLEWKEEDSLTINSYKYDIPRGVFLSGFDYRSGKEWLKSAVRINENEYFNPTNKTKGELIWSN